MFYVLLSVTLSTVISSISGMSGTAGGGIITMVHMFQFYKNNVLSHTKQAKAEFVHLGPGFDTGHFISMAWNSILDAGSTKYVSFAHFSIGLPPVSE